MASLAGSGSLLLKGFCIALRVQVVPSFIHCSLACRIDIAFECLESLVNLGCVFHLEDKVVMPIDVCDVMLDRGSVESGIEDFAQACVVR